MRTRRAATLAASAALALCACGSHGARSDQDAAIALARDATYEGELDLEGDGWQEFTLAVPEDALLVRLQLGCEKADLDLYADTRGPIEDAAAAELSAETDEWGEALALSRFSDPALAAGMVWIGVHWPYPDVLRVGHERVTRVSFTLRASVFTVQAGEQLQANVPLASSVDTARGDSRTFAIDVPEDARALRIDLTGVASDLDLLARAGQPVLHLDDDVAFSRNPWGRETLVVTRASDPPLAPGPWFVDVVDPFDSGRTIPFTILASLSEEPPPALLDVPAIPPPRGDGPLARALTAVVELSGDQGGGSGTLIGEDGWILSNAHVFGSSRAGEVVVSITLDPRLPPVESFRGALERYDEARDLALVHVRSGLYGQPLPQGYRFPALELGDPDALAIGDPLWLVGYPMTGGTGNRVSISATRGVVSGFDMADFGALIKTDAEITSGNSGGAALDAQGRLVGVPTSTIEVGSAQIGYVHPLSALPAEWRALLSAGH